MAALMEEQDKRRGALIERLGTVADLACATPLPGKLGDVAYDLLRQAAAQIASDRQHIARLAHSEPRPVAGGLREAARQIKHAQDTTDCGCKPCDGHAVREALATHSPAPMAGEVERLREALVGLCSAYVALDIEGHRHASGSWYQHARATLSSTRGGAEG